MQAQPEQTTDELILEIEGKTITSTVKDVTSASGIRLETNDKGETRGKYDGSRIETTIIQIRPDGTIEWESKGFDMTRDRGVIGFVGKAKGDSAIQES